MQNFGQVELRCGDAIVIEAEENFNEYHKLDTNFAFVKPIMNSKPPRVKSVMDVARQITLIVLLVLMIGLAFFVDVVILTFFFALILILNKTVTMKEAYASIPAPLLISSALSISIGTGLSNIGLTDSIADFTAHYVQSDWLLILLIYLFTLALTLMLTQLPAAIMMVPFAIEIHNKTTLPLNLLIYVIIFAASAGFATPYAIQTNLIVMAPGGYKKKDYLRLGLPLNIIMCVMTCVLCFFIYRR